MRNNLSHYIYSARWFSEKKSPQTFFQYLHKLEANEIFAHFINASKREEDVLGERSVQTFHSFEHLCAVHTRFIGRRSFSKLLFSDTSGYMVSDNFPEQTTPSFDQSLFSSKFEAKNIRLTPKDFAYMNKN